MNTRRSIVKAGAGLAAIIAAGKAPAALVRSLVAARNAMMAGGGISAKSYVQDGLVAMWDGIENAGWGVHETSPAKWKNLITGSAFPDFNIETGKSFGADHLIVNGLTARSASAWPSAFVVLDEVYRLDSGYAFFNLNMRNRIQWGVDAGADAARNYPQFSGMQTSGQNVFHYPAFAYGKHHSLSVFYASSGNAGAYQIGLNGEILQPTGTGNQNTSSPSITSIGSRYGVSSSYNSSTGIFNCIRLYSRALTADEIAANYAVDKARFNLPDAT